MIGSHPGDDNLLACNRAGDKKRSRLDPVRNSLFFSAVQVPYPFNYNTRRSSPFDLCALLVEKIGQINYLRLARSIFDDGRAIGEYRGHHNVVGPKDSSTKFPSKRN